MNTYGGNVTGWLMQGCGSLLRWFLTLTTAYSTSRHELGKKGFKFVEGINRYLYGQHFRNNGTGLVTVFNVEGRKFGKPHLHMMLQDHPALTSELLLHRWLRLAGERTQPTAQDIQYATNPEVIRHNLRYTLKDIRSLDDPWIFIPVKEPPHQARLRKTKRLSARRYKPY